MFSFFDLVFPIGTAAIALFLCIWGILKTDKTVAKFICAITAAVFVLAIPAVYLMRYSSSKYDWGTFRGMRVVQGKLNKCEQSTVQSWENDLVGLWGKVMPLVTVVESLNKKYLICKDEERLSLEGVERFFRGYSTDAAAVIGWRDLAYAKSLYRHEVSHLILSYSGVPYDESIQHQKMKEANLGD